MTEITSNVGRKYYVSLFSPFLKFNALHNYLKADENINK